MDFSPQDAKGGKKLMSREKREGGEGEGEIKPRGEAEGRVGSRVEGQSGERDPELKVEG